MSQIKDAVTRGNPRDLKRVLNIRGEDSDLDTANFGGTLSSADDTAQKAFDTLDDIFGSAVSITGDLTVTGNGQFISTDAGAGTGPDLNFYRNSASPGADDFLTVIRFQGNDSGGGKQEYAAFVSQILDATAGSEDGRFKIAVTSGGSPSEVIFFEQGVYTTNASGGDQGADTINASGLYVDGTSTDSLYFTRTPDFESAEQTVSTDNALSVAHSLGAVPTWVQVILRCKTADLNYSAAEEIHIDGHQHSLADRGFIVSADSTNVNIITGAGITLLDKSTFNTAAITTSSWRWVIRAWT